MNSFEETPIAKRLKKFYIPANYFFKAKFFFSFELDILENCQNKITGKRAFEK